MTAGRPAGLDNQGPARAGGREEGLAVGTMFLITGTGLFAVSVLARSQWLLAVTCLVIGVQIERAGPPAGSSTSRSASCCCLPRGTGGGAAGAASRLPSARRPGQRETRWSGTCGTARSRSRRERAGGPGEDRRPSW